MNGALVSGGEDRLNSDPNKERAVQVRVSRRIVQLDMAVALLEGVQRDAVGGDQIRKLDVLVLNDKPEEHQLVVFIVDTELERLLPEGVEAIIVDMARLVFDR